MLPDLPSDDDGPPPRADPKALQPKGGKRPRADRPLACKRSLTGKSAPATGLQLVSGALPELPDALPELPDDDDGDLPDDVLEDLALDGPLQGPAGRPARVRARRVAKVVFPGRSVQEVMQSLEMVPHRQAQLWNAQVPQHLQDIVQDDLMEIYSPERMAVWAKKLGLRAELSIDLLTGWNLLDAEVRLKVVREISVRRPKVLMMSPPCTWFSGLMNLNWGKINPVVREQGLRDATLHLEFCMLLADIQESQHRGWAFAHPDTAKSWQNPKVKWWVDRGAFVTRFDQCMFGLVSKVETARMKKRTRFMTNIKPLYAAFDKKVCDKSHGHVSVQGSEGGEKRSVWAQRYPPALCEAAVQAFAVYCRQ